MRPSLKVPVHSRLEMHTVVLAVSKGRGFQAVDADRHFIDIARFDDLQRLIAIVSGSNSQRALATNLGICRSTSYRYRWLRSQQPTILAARAQTT